MSFWNEDHPMQWKYEQVQAAIPAWGVSDNEKFSDSTNEDLTEAANLICLVYDYYNNGSLAANIEVRLSRYNEECKHGAQFCKDWFDQVMYWYENDCMPSDEEQEWYATDWMETMLNCIDFEYDESKNPANKKPKKAKVAPESPESPKRKRDESPETPKSKKAKVAPKSPESPKKDKFKVSKEEFAEFRLCQKGALPMPEWFVKDKTKQNEVIERTAEIAAYYKL